MRLPTDVEMHFKIFLIALACCSIETCFARSLKTDFKFSQDRQILEESHELEEISRITEDDYGNPDSPSPNEILEAARNVAIQVYMSKMAMALGRDIIEYNPKWPQNGSFPTVASPLNITTPTCSPMYTKCSSGRFVSSCHPPSTSDPDLWGQRLNLYFETPRNLLSRDKLLNATLKIYKNSSLPLSASSKLVVELFVYTRGLTKDFDINFICDFVEVRNDYIGWISFDITDLMLKMNFTDHHGFLVKVKEEIGVYWNDPYLIIPTNCTDNTKPVIPVPFGVATNQPEERSPSLMIHTGLLNEYYSGISSDDSDILMNDNLEEYGSGEAQKGTPPPVNSIFRNNDFYQKFQDLKRSSEMSSDDARIQMVDDEPEFDIDIEEDEELVPTDGFNSPQRKIKHHHVRIKTIYNKAHKNQVYNSDVFKNELNPTTSTSIKPDVDISHNDWKLSNIWPSVNSSGDGQTEKEERRKRYSKKRHQKNFLGLRKAHSRHNGHRHHSHKSHKKSSQSHHQGQVNQDNERHLTNKNS